MAGMNPETDGGSLPGTGLQVRLATAADVAAINDIYNHYVLTSTCTYDDEPESLASRLAWFGQHDAAHPITVATAHGELRGWGALSPFRSRWGYRFTVEHSVYVHPRWHRHGIGRILLCDLIDRARALGHRSMIGGISADQQPSIALHAALGFTPVGQLREVGYKFGRWLDLVFMQRMLP